MLKHKSLAVPTIDSLATASTHYDTAKVMGRRYPHADRTGVLTYERKTLFNPSSVSELYPSKWVKAEDLDGDHGDGQGIIAVTVETFRQPDGSSKPSVVLAFEGKAKRMIL